jgi:hypothetical protein
MKGARYLFVPIALVLAAFRVNAGGGVPLTLTQDNPPWGNDVVVSGSEPVGRHSGVARPNGTVYAAVPDTSGASSFTVKIYRSTNFGNTWALHSTGPVSTNPFTKTKLLRTNVDSIYCTALTGSSLYCWNVESPTFVLFSGEAARDFDIASTNSANELHLFVDVLTSNSLRRYASIDGGRTWINGATVTSAGAHPRVYMSTGDTLVLNYYGPVLADTTTSIIRAARYRKTGLGTMASINFTDIVTETVKKDQFASVIHGGAVWFFYTAGDSGARDLKCRVSSDNGASYGAPFNVAADSARDEYWFDAKHSSGGCHLIFVADTAGPSDKLLHTSAVLANPSTFSPAQNVSEHAPVSAAFGYIPGAVAFGDTDGNLGALWVGRDASARRVYWDRLNAQSTGVALTAQGLPQSFALQQNYPNPFNPSTHIRFSVGQENRRMGEAEKVWLMVFDVLGREVATLVNEVRPPGEYEVVFDASHLASGVYYYRLSGGSFVSTRKMILLR